MDKADQVVNSIEVRRNQFVVATDVHYPTDRGLIGDGLRTIVATARRLAGLPGADGWRQHRPLLRAVKEPLRVINRIAAARHKSDVQVLSSVTRRDLMPTIAVTLRISAGSNHG